MGVEVRKSELDSMQVFSEVNQADLKSVDLFGPVIETQLRAIHSRERAMISEHRDLQAHHGGLGQVGIEGSGGLQADDPGLAGIDIGQAGELKAEPGGFSLRPVENTRSRYACKSLLRDAADCREVNSVDAAVFA
jgi:hypothetical protein